MDDLLPVHVLQLRGGRVVVITQCGGFEPGKVMDLNTAIAAAQRHKLSLLQCPYSRDLSIPSHNLRNLVQSAAVHLLRSEAYVIDSSLS